MAILWSGIYPQIDNINGTSVDFTMAATQAGSGYWVITPATESWPTAANIVAGRDATNQPCPTGRFGVTALVSGVAVGTSGYALTSEFNYRISLIASGNDASSSAISGIAFTTDDITVPVWITGYPNVTSVVGVTATVRLAINEAGSGYWVTVPSASGAPSAAQIKAGQNSGGTAVASGLYGSSAISGSGVIISGSLTNLVSETAYRVYSVAQDTSVNLMAAGSGVLFTTTDVTAPAWVAGYPLITPSTTVNSSGTLSLKLDSAGYAWYVIVPSGSSAPSAAQIKAYTNASNVAITAGLYGSGTLVANTTATLCPSALAYSTYYTIYVTANDTSSNATSPAVVSANFRASVPKVSAPSSLFKNAVEQRRKLDNALRNM